MLSIWNLFSGTLKYAVELPPPKLIGSDIKDFNPDLSDSSESSKIDSISSEELSDIEGGKTLSHKSKIYFNNDL